MKKFSTASGIGYKDKKMLVWMTRSRSDMCNFYDGEQLSLAKMKKTI